MPGEACYLFKFPAKVIFFGPSPSFRLTPPDIGWYKFYFRKLNSLIYKYSEVQFGKS
jgi:hypothetical protein